MNIFATAFASAADEFGHKDRRFAENLRAIRRISARTTSA